MGGMIITKLRWDQLFSFEHGVDRGVYFPTDAPAEAWSGLVSVEEITSDESYVRYIDGVKTRQHRRPGEFSGKIEAMTYPSSLESVIGSRNKTFGFSYRVTKPSGFLIHLVYNVKISREGFLRNQFEATTFSWNFSTLPVAIPGEKPSAHVIVDTSKAYSSTVDAFENMLYGDDSHSARLPSPEEVLEIFEENSIVRVIDNGDGTYSVSGPDDIVYMNDATTWTVDWPSAVYIDADTYTIRSL